MREQRSLKARFEAWLHAPDSPLDVRMVREQCRQADTNDEASSLFDEQEHRAAGRVAMRLRAWDDRRGVRLARITYCVLCVCVCLALITLLLYTTSLMPRFGDMGDPINNEVSERYIEKGLQETGAVNIVTGMILDYRAFDTLGESTVLFAAAMTVLLLLRLDADSARFSLIAVASRENPNMDEYYEPRDDTILQHTAVVLVPMIALMGIYVVLNGHLSPGGGFSGGAIIGSGLIVYVAAFGFKRIRRFFTYRTYQITVLLALMTYALSKCYSFYTGANGIASAIPLGTPGAILSSGLILVLNICVGFIVACTIYAFYALFRKGGL